MASDSGVGIFSEKLAAETESGLDLLTKYRESSLYTRAKYIPIKPLHALTDQGPYQFMIGGRNSSDIVMLRSLRLSIKFKVVKNDGSDLPANESVSVVNTIGHSLFENISVKLCDTPISDHARLYPYKAFIQQTFSFSNDVKTHNLNCEYFKADDTTQSATVTIPAPVVAPAVDNSAFTIRKAWIAESKICSLSIVPYIDLMSTNHFLCPGHNLFLEFERSKSEFSLLAASNLYKIKIIDLTIWARVLEPLPAISASLERSKMNGLIQYPLTRNVLRTFQIHTGTSRIEINNIFRGTLPRAVYVFFLENSQIVGTINKNPFVFRHFNVMETHVTIGGFPYPAEPIRTNFTANEEDVMPAFRWLLDNIGIQDHDCNVGITADDFVSNLFMIPFDLSPRGDNGHQPHVTQNGEMSFVASLRAALSQPITVLFHAVFENSITVDKNGLVSLDYQI